MGDGEKDRMAPYCAHEEGFNTSAGIIGRIITTSPTKCYSAHLYTWTEGVGWGLVGGVVSQKESQIVIFVRIR